MIMVEQLDDATHPTEVPLYYADYTSTFTLFIKLFIIVIFEQYILAKLVAAKIANFALENIIELLNQQLEIITQSFQLYANIPAEQHILSDKDVILEFKIQIALMLQVLPDDEPPIPATQVISDDLTYIVDFQIEIDFKFNYVFNIFPHINAMLEKAIILLFITQILLIQNIQQLKNPIMTAKLISVVEYTYLLDQLNQTHKFSKCVTKLFAESYPIVPKLENCAVPQIDIVTIAFQIDKFPSIIPNYPTLLIVLDQYNDYSVIHQFQISNLVFNYFEYPIICPDADNYFVVKLIYKRCTEFCNIKAESSIQLIIPPNQNSFKVESIQVITFDKIDEPIKNANYYSFIYENITLENKYEEKLPN
ncbi:Hypothetical_protein [Hexamita inflata]|uniref:Hypothetical_protein n=1 Tax=Hexamita inflata TaxID=28002 RepID=A0AA86UST2_9EUKA|nr:Hypothetical protein HINF_LOCUS51001 [Hexamita inflata]